MSIHPTAIVDPGAELGADVEVGPYAIVEAGVRVGARTRILPHALLHGPLEMGEDNEVGFSAVVGVDPQVREAASLGPTFVGDRNIFREFTQVHRSIRADGETRIGNDCLFMGCAHVAHDCIVHDHVTVANSALLAGHVEVGRRAVIGGNASVHQFARVGTLAMVGGGSAINQDVPPFCIAVGMRPAVLKGLNLIGLRRAGLPRESRQALRRAYRQLFRSDLALQDRLRSVEIDADEVRELVDFVANSPRGVTGFGGSSGLASAAAADD